MIGIKRIRMDEKRQRVWESCKLWKVSNVISTKSLGSPVWESCKLWKVSNSFPIFGVCYIVWESCKLWKVSNYCSQPFLQKLFESLVSYERYQTVGPAHCQIGLFESLVSYERYQTNTRRDLASALVWESCKLWKVSNISEKVFKRTLFESLVSYERYQTHPHTKKDHTQFESLVSYERYQTGSDCQCCYNWFESLVSYKRYGKINEVWNEYFCWQCKGA